MSGEDDQGGVYHSNYDTFEHYMRFGDPQFAYGVALAQTAGRAVLRMADADVLPMQFAAFAETVGGYLDELHKLTDDKRKKAEDLGKLLDQNAFVLAADPTRVVGAPEREPEVPYLDFAPLDNVVARLNKSAKAYDEAYAKVAEGTTSLTPAQRASVNAQLRVLEQALTSPNGLPGRELVQAPHLRARPADGLWREDVARRARSRRGQSLGGSEPLCGHHGEGAGSVLRPAREGDGAARIRGSRHS